MSETGCTEAQEYHYPDEGPCGIELCQGYGKQGSQPAHDAPDAQDDTGGHGKGRKVQRDKGQNIPQYANAQNPQ